MTVTTLGQLRRAALRLPEVGEGTHHGMIAFAVRGRGFLAVTDDRVVQVQLPDDLVDRTLQTHPTAEPLLRMGARVGVAVPLAGLGGQELNQLVRASWEHVAPKRLVAATRAAEASTEHGLPAGIGRPATRALLAAGITTLDEVAQRTDAELLALHGVGPRAVRVLRETIAGEG
ncbi:hypothetical protein [Ornithinimicrobium cavernae]|uniref:hypothetical protein n=1 Tax=Ornithinimicrobium cavernae TaxID=2666047 RepID=UPI001F2B0523|nr:hypothetical protein [Ornithinimicrobium cavernae]